MRSKFKDSLDSKNISRYLKQIAKFSQLTPKEEKDLGHLIQKGDKKAQGKLVESNLRFVVSYVKKYRGMGLSLPDLINEGNLGLIEAAKRFDPEKKVKFISYAVWWIHQAGHHPCFDQVFSHLSHPAKAFGSNLQDEKGKSPAEKRIGKGSGER